MKNANNVRGITLIEVVLCLVIVGILAAALFPMFPRHHTGASHQSNCQSNLKQIGVAIKTYLVDWDDTYPTNRPFLANGKLGPVASSVDLSKAGTDNTTGKPFMFEHGLTWIEGLYQYIEPITAQGDASSVWKCQCASTEAYPVDSKTAAVTYVFNRNLVEKTGKCVKNPSALMMVREVDRLVNSELRPTNDSTKSNQPPQSAFLTAADSYMPGVIEVNNKLHAKGSNVLCADGHVKLFDENSLPANCKWDPKTKTWANATGTITVSP